MNDDADNLRASREAQIAGVIRRAAGDQINNESDDAQITVSLEGDCADVTIVKAHECVEFGIHDVEAIAKLLGTDRINFGHRSYERGYCSSCDFGAKYTVELRIHGIQFPITN